jgi:hypothetical protein
MRAWRAGLLDADTLASDRRDITAPGHAMQNAAWTGYLGRRKATA